jgi:hypothetical protein
MRLLYEAEKAEVPERLDDVHNSLMVWRQRDRVSVEDVAHRVMQLTSTQQPHAPAQHNRLALLAEFFKEVIIVHHRQSLMCEVAYVCSYKCLL